jgi:hypothetical protein
LTPSRAVVQSAGHAFRLKADLLKNEFGRFGPTMHLLLRYAQALITQMAQTTVCNGKQSSPKCATDRDQSQSSKQAIEQQTQRTEGAVSHAADAHRVPLNCNRFMVRVGPPGTPGFQCALRKVDHDVRLLRSGDGSIPLRFSTLAIVARPTS